MASIYTAAGGPRLSEILDALPVETRWTAGHHIVWQTGQQNAPDRFGLDDHTHCSAFVAAVAQMLGIYVLRPPAHRQDLLANAQADWLAGGPVSSAPMAAVSGWSGLGTADNSAALMSAVEAASAGQLVLAAYKAPPVVEPGGPVHQRSGHVCIVRPLAATSYDPDTGPDVISVGTINALTMPMRTAFREHPLAWPQNIALYASRTDLQADMGS